MRVYNSLSVCYNICAMCGRAYLLAHALYMYAARLCKIVRIQRPHVCVVRMRRYEYFSSFDGYNYGRVVKVVCCGC